MSPRRVLPRRWGGCPCRGQAASHAETALCPQGTAVCAPGDADLLASPCAAGEDSRHSVSRSPESCFSVSTFQRAKLRIFSGRGCAEFSPVFPEDTRLKGRDTLLLPPQPGRGGTRGRGRDVEDPRSSGRRCASAFSTFCSHGTLVPVPLGRSRGGVSPETAAGMGRYGPVRTFVHGEEANSEIWKKHVWSASFWDP